MPGSSFVDFVVDQLAALGDVHGDPMFGGHGLYAGPVFFGIIHEEQLFLKTDPTTRRAYVDRGMGPFRPNPRQTLKSYYQVPADVVEDPRALLEWARRAVGVARGKDVLP